MRKHIWCMKYACWQQIIRTRRALHDALRSFEMSFIRRRIPVAVKLWLNAPRAFVTPREPNISRVQVPQIKIRVERDDVAPLLLEKPVYWTSMSINLARNRYHWFSPFFSSSLLPSPFFFIISVTLIALCKLLPRCLSLITIPSLRHSRKRPHINAFRRNVLFISSFKRL